MAERRETDASGVAFATTDAPDKGVSCAELRTSVRSSAAPLERRSGLSGCKNVNKRENKPGMDRAMLGLHFPH
jgi:hypothetical protein